MNLNLKWGSSIKNILLFDCLEKIFLLSAFSHLSSLSYPCIIHFHLSIFSTFLPFIFHSMTTLNVLHILFFSLFFLRLPPPNFLSKIDCWIYLKSFFFSTISIIPHFIKFKYLSTIIFSINYQGDFLSTNLMHWLSKKIIDSFMEKDDKYDHNKYFIKFDFSKVLADIVALFICLVQPSQWCSWV